jgi:hypothetical protein
MLMEKTKCRIDVETCGNGLGIIPVQTLGWGQAFVVIVTDDYRAIRGTYATGRAQISIDIAGLPAHPGSEMAHFALH